MDGLELMCFQIITSAGTARSNYIEAIQEVKRGNKDRAEVLMQEGRQQYLQGHEVHSRLLTRESGGEATNSSILVMHAEDQLMSAEAFQIVAKEFIDTYLRLIELEKKME